MNGGDHETLKDVRQMGRTVVLSAEHAERQCRARIGRIPFHHEYVYGDAKDGRSIRMLNTMYPDPFSIYSTTKLF